MYINCLLLVYACFRFIMYSVHIGCILRMRLLILLVEKEEQVFLSPPLPTIIMLSMTAHRFIMRAVQGIDLWCISSMVYVYTITHAHHIMDINAFHWSYMICMFCVRWVLRYNNVHCIYVLHTWSAWYSCYRSQLHALYVIDLLSKHKMWCTKKPWYTILHCIKKVTISYRLLLYVINQCFIH